MNKVICFGEMLVDFICENKDVSLKDGHHFSKKAGGAPANVAVGIAKLGGNSAFIGKVGADPFGEFLKQRLQDFGVDDSHLLLDKHHKTSLAFVSIKEGGERDFVFFREPGADTQIEVSDIDFPFLQTANLFHFGSISLIQDPIRSTALASVEFAKSQGTFISFDPNLRINLWESEKIAQKSIRQGLPYADYVKLSELELEFITEETDKVSAIKKIHEYGASFVTVTLSGNGAIVSNGDQIAHVAGYKVDTIDTTGAGDGFAAGVLYCLGLLDNIRERLIDFNFLKDIVDFANKVGALTTTKYGAIAALPTMQEVQNINAEKRLAITSY